MEIQRVKVLITNIVLSGRTGTEIVTRDLALGLQRAGAEPSVYSPVLGPLADVLREAGIPVMSDIGEVDAPPDIIHGHHSPTTAAAVARFPGTPALFLCHDLEAWHDIPPLLPSIRRYVAISEGFRRRLTAEGVAEAQTRVILNGVDTGRFEPGPPPPARPARALAFAKNEGHLAAIRSACERLAIGLDVIGAAVGRIEAAPERLIAGYDLVFTSALSAIEAMACGRPVVVCDGRGLAGFVDEQRYEAWRPENFGKPVLTQPLTADTVAAEILRYDANAALAVCLRLRRDASLEAWTGRWLELYGEVIEEAAAHPAPPDFQARALARHLQTWAPRVGPEWPWMRESLRLEQEQEKRRTGLLPLAWGETATPAMGGLLQLTGFHPAEPWGAWARTRAPLAVLRAPPCQAPVDLILDYAVYLTAERPHFDVVLLANGLEVAAWRDEVSDTPMRRRAIALPSGVLGDTDGVALQFRTSPLAAPLDEGGTDPRRLGLGLAGIALSPAPQPL
jgi:hypothetical protein